MLDPISETLPPAAARAMTSELAGKRQAFEIALGQVRNRDGKTGGFQAPAEILRLARGGSRCESVQVDDALHLLDGGSLLDSGAARRRRSGTSVNLSSESDENSRNAS